MSMTPEKIAELKKLQAEYKEYREGLKENKTELFGEILEMFGDRFESLKKDLTTISTGEPFTDGNVWAITFGVEAGSEDEAKDSKEVAKELLEAHLDAIEHIIGIGSSGKITGKYKGQNCYLQFRKR